MTMSITLAEPNLSVLIQVYHPTFANHGYSESILQSMNKVFKKEPSVKTDSNSTQHDRKLQLFSDLMKKLQFFVPIESSGSWFETKC